jgi:phytoene synthase
MTNIDFFKQTCYRISELITKKYSTSFSLAGSLLEKEERKAIYAIYGFVRLADEIVDSFDGFDKEFLLEKLKNDLDYALLNGISTNPVILAFVDTVKKYRIEKKFIDAFIRSMEYDLYKNNEITSIKNSNFVRIKQRK